MMMNTISQRYLISLFILGVLLTSPIHSQTSFENSQMIPIKYYSNSYKVFTNNDIGQTLANSDTLKSPRSSERDIDSSKAKVKIGKIIGFATIGFVSGFFIGASTEKSGFFQGPVFHLKPALIGAGLGIVLSFIVPDKDKKRNKKQD